MGINSLYWMLDADADADADADVDADALVLLQHLFSRQWRVSSRSPPVSIPSWDCFRYKDLT